MLNINYNETRNLLALKSQNYMFYSSQYPCPFFPVLGDMVIATLGHCKWQSYWKTKSSILQPCTVDAKLDLLYYGLPGLTSILGLHLHGKSFFKLKFLYLTSRQNLKFTVKVLSIFSCSNL